MIRTDKEFRFAIVGAGPAGFYCAKQLLDTIKNIRIDIFDRNVHPYGLVRTAIAPDHRDMKTITSNFE